MTLSNSHAVFILCQFIRENYAATDFTIWFTHKEGFYFLAQGTKWSAYGRLVILVHFLNEYSPLLTKNLSLAPRKVILEHTDAFIFSIQNWSFWADTSEEDFNRK